MKKYRYKGQMIEVDLEQFGYSGYFAETLYQCEDDIGKSLITMFLVQKDKDGEPFNLIPIQKSQYITADRSDVRTNIVRIVEHLCRTKKIDRYLLEGELKLEKHCE